MSGSITTLDGSVIAGTISGVTAHTWTADATGTFQTTTNLQAEWQAAYTVMLAGNGATLTPLQRLEGNAEAVIDNTKASQLSAASQAQFRADAQREFDAIYAAMQINQVVYGTNPNAPFTAATYLQMQATLQGNEALKTLGLQGHGLNNPPSVAYNGFTTSFQNRTDGTTFYVGGGTDTGETAIANFFDDVALSHAPFPEVVHNGVVEQLNQNGNLEDTLATVLPPLNAEMFTRVLVAADFSTSATATGPTVTIAAAAAPAAPVAVPGTFLSYDGALVPATITGLAHAWTTDSTGQYLTTANLQAEWQADYAVMLAGHGDTLTALQRMEGNAEAVVENTKASQLTASSLADFRMYAQREFDAVWAAMQQNQVLYGINPNQQFNTYTYTRLQATLQDNPILVELAIQGHGVNSPPATKYDGFTTDFQNRTDGSTYYVGGGTENGTLAISSFFDDEILTHAPFPTAEQNGTLDQLNQNGNIESSLATAIAASNAVDFTRVYVASDFSTNAAAVGAVQLVPNALAAPAMPTSITPTVTLSAVVQAGTTLLVGGSGNAVTVAPGGSVTTTGTGPNTINLGSGSDTVVSNGADTIMGGSGTAVITVNTGATIMGGTGQLSVQGGTGATQATAGSGGLTYQGGSGVDTVIGQGNMLRVTGGTGGGVYFGGGNAIITAGAGGPLDVEIGGNGDQLIGAGSTGVLFGTSGGAVTMSSLADTGNSVFFGANGSGKMTFITGSGSDLLALGQGTNTVTLGSGHDVIFGNGGTTSVSTITAGSGALDMAFSGASTDLVINAGAARAFNLYLYSAGADRITLQGYSATQAAMALANQTHSAGGTQLSLSDGSVISLLGVSQATAGLFG